MHTTRTKLTATGARRGLVALLALSCASGHQLEAQSRPAEIAQQRARLRAVEQFRALEFIPVTKHPPFVFWIQKPHRAVDQALYVAATAGRLAKPLKKLEAALVKDLMAPLKLKAKVRSYPILVLASSEDYDEYGAAPQRVPG